jgi:ketol-acid reductoisomerase
VNNIKPTTGILNHKRVAIIGFGSQGQAQALNLRDSGVEPIIGLRAKSKSRKLARALGFKITNPLTAVNESEIIVILIPDHKHKELFETISSRQMREKSFIFAHGLSIAFGLVKIPSTSDIILLAPHGPGIRIRELYTNGKSFTSFWAIENDATGQAEQIGKAYATAIGCPPKNLFKSTFHDEAVGDIFGEQAVLCGGLVSLMEMGFNTLVKNGFSSENAYLECVYQLDLIIDLIKKYGPAGMFEKISKTAAFGSLEDRGIIFDRQISHKMQALYEKIESGSFARNLMNKRAMKDLDRNLKKLKDSLLQKTHNSLQKKLL